MAFWDKQTTIGTVKKNKVENLIVSVCEIDNKKFIDIRTYRHFKDDEYKATSKGITLPFNKKQELLDILNKIKDD